jgi:hypothetical protein
MRQPTFLEGSTVGKDGAVEPWTDRYPWAYIDAAKTQLGLLVHGMSRGSIRPSPSQVVHLDAALDDLVLQVALLRQMLADDTTHHEHYQR